VFVSFMAATGDSFHAIRAKPFLALTTGRSESVNLSHRIYPKVQELLGLSNASDLLLTALLRCVNALANPEDAKNSKAMDFDLPDLILLKYSLERAPKSQKCNAVLSMFPRSPSQQVLHLSPTACFQSIPIL
jgi:hypothetical protein